MCIRDSAVAVDQPPAVWLWSLDDLAAPPRSVPLPAPTAQLSLDTAANTVLAPVPSANQLLRITPTTGAATSLAVDGGPVSAATVAGHTLVALGQAKAVAVFDGDQLARTISGVTSADQVVANDRHAAMVDRLRTAVFTLDPTSTSQGPGLRAGDGAVNAVTDRFDRVLVTDARSGELLVFSLDPLLMRQRFPVPGTPYGIAYDPGRDLAWVTLTERNEVVGYDVAGGEPVERYRFPTVTQPNSVTVDPSSGRVFVASATGQGVQVVQP